MPRTLRVAPSATLPKSKNVQKAWQGHGTAVQVGGSLPDALAIALANEDERNWTASVRL